MNPLIRKLLARADSMYQGWMKSRQYELPENVEQFRDIAYIDDGKGYHQMDIFRPKGAEGKLPVIVNFHGGGLVLCTREVNRPFCAELAKRGFLVFSVDYPVVPEKDVPGILGDVCAGLDAVDSMLESRGGDRERVFLVGDSAGAFLAVYAAAIQADAKIAEAALVRPPKLPVHALGLISGMLHTADSDETGIFLRGSFYGKNWRSHPLLPYLKPEREAVASLMPPCFLVTSKGDKLRSGTLRFHEGLKKSGIRCQLLDFPRSARMPHDFVIMYPQRPAAAGAMDQMAAFLLKNGH